MANEKDRIPEHQPPIQSGEATEIGPRRGAANPGNPGEFVTTERFEDRITDLHDSIKEIRIKDEGRESIVNRLSREIGEDKTKIQQHGQAIERVFEELRHAGGQNVNLQSAFATLNIKLDQSLEAHGFTTSIRDTIVKAVTVGILVAGLIALVYGITLLRDLGQ